MIAVTSVASMPSVPLMTGVLVVATVRRSGGLIWPPVLVVLVVVGVLVVVVMRAVVGGRGGAGSLSAARFLMRVVVMLMAGAVPPRVRGTHQRLPSRCRMHTPVGYPSANTASRVRIPRWIPRSHAAGARPAPLAPP